MKYDVAGFPESKFHQANELVRATLLASGRVDVWNSPRRITTDHQTLAKAHRSKVAEFLEAPEEIRGVTFPSQNNAYEYDIWLNPAIVDENDANFRATILHELCHGYRGVGKGHDQSWRRLYARALFHYNFTVATIDHWGAIVDLTNWRYTKRGKTESTGDFLKRIAADKEKWIKQAEEDQQRVNDLWCSMMNPNWNGPTLRSKRRKRSPGI